MEIRAWRGHLGVPVSFLVFALVLVSTPAHAAKYAGAFMEDGGGARALAMGSAFTAVANDPSTTFWNPAGLSRTRTRELLLMHAERFGDLIDRDFASFVAPVNWSLLGGTESSVGVSVIRLGIDNIPFTEHLHDRLDTNHDGIVDDNELLGLFDLQDQFRFKSDSEFALMVSYGERRGSWLVGGTLKLIRQSVGDYSSLGIGTDVGLIRPRLWRNLDFGVKLQDITTTYLSWSTGTNEVIYPAITPGLAYTFNLPRMNMDVVVASSAECRFENRVGDQYKSGSFSANTHWGMEVGFARRVFIRGGFNSGFSAENLTAGAGFRIDPLTVDYAYAGDVLNIDEYTHRISLSVRF